MANYILRRIAMALFTLFSISVLAFIIIQLPPGDYVTSYISQLSSDGSGVSDAQIQKLRDEYGLDYPIYVQYFFWISKIIVNGDFGYSMEWGKPVTAVIEDHLLLTVIVAGSGIMLTWIIALPIGIYSAVNQYSKLDFFFTFLGFVGLAIPNFMLALILMYLGFVYFSWNVGGLFSSEFVSAEWSLLRLWDLFKHLPIPALVLGAAGTAELIRIMRANLLDELRKPYVTSARARGMPERRLILKYPVRIALNPFVSTIGYLFPQIVSGSIVVSLVLSLPTVGPLLLRALLSQDMFMAGAIVLMLGAMTLVGTLVSDLLLIWIDPRIRMGARR